MLDSQAKEAYHDPRQKTDQNGPHELLGLTVTLNIFHKIPPSFEITIPFYTKIADPAKSWIGDS